MSGTCLMLYARTGEVGNGIRSLGQYGIPGYQEGHLVEDPDDPPPMTITAEGVPITLDAPERGLGRFTPTRIIRNMMGGLGGLAAWEMARDRMARGIENADFGPTRALRVLPEGMREWMADDFDERRLTADDLPGNVHDFARMIAAQAITKAGTGADLSGGIHVPYPTQEFAAEHFDPSLIDKFVAKRLGMDRDVREMTRDQRNEAIGFTDPSGWGATFGQGTMYEDPEGNIHLIDRYNFSNMTAGQLPNRITGMEMSPYATGMAPHDSGQFREDLAALWGEVDPTTGEKKPAGRRATNLLRHYMSEFGSTEGDTTEGRSWDINLGPREELLAAYEAALDPQPSRMARGLGWLKGFFSRDDDVQVAEAGTPRMAEAPPVDELAALRAQLGALDSPTISPDISVFD